MAIRDTIARLIGDRSASLPAPSVGATETIRQTRFAEGLTSGFSRSSPYIPLVAQRNAAVVPQGIHPGTPPVMQIKGVRGVATGPTKVATSKPSATESHRPSYGSTNKLGSSVLIGGARKVVRR